MLYAASKDALKKKLQGITHEIQGNGLDELDYDDVLNKISAGRTK
jgi:cofilin